MTYKEYIQSEADNVNRVCLYQEGLFWKAYERSAYILCTQVHPFKPTKKASKSLGGGEIVSVGFPVNREEHYVGALERITSEEKHLVLQAVEEIDVAAFEQWKADVPTPAESATRRKGKSEEADACSDALQTRIREFNLAESTPMECMLFVSELKKMV